MTLARFKILSFFLSVPLLLLLAKLFLPQDLSMEMQKKAFWSEKIHSREKYDIIVYGDSRVFEGISPSHLNENKKGLKAINLGLPSGGLNNDIYSFIETRLDKTKTPIIVLGISPLSFTRDSEQNNFYAEQSKKGEFQHLKNKKFAPYLSLFNRYSPSDIYFREKPFPFRYFQAYHQNGWSETYTDHIDEDEQIPSYKSWFKKNRVEPDLLLEFYRQIKSWRQGGIQVITLRMPTSLSMRDLENELSGFDENKIRREIKNAGGLWLEVQNEEFQSYDGSHLHFESAIALSKKIGEIIR